ncbi:toxin-antitoxin system YwqK family antitoxin [Sungkyunkwania multivorans]|uniref:Toxin-antitoxin system YwqK family antitoxin n=1 Tax=Sungkyunkwania multivorans TaxID=1173618 RepID=A0ABW3CU47_9FLAO
MSIRHHIEFIIFLTFNLSVIYAQNTVNGFDSEGKRHGIWKKYYEGTEQLRYEGQFEHGKEIGVFKYYSKKSKQKPIATRAFNTDDDTAQVTYYALNQQVISKGKMRGKLRIGEWLYYHQNSDLIMNKENYKDGVLHGLSQVYYKNGQLLEELHYEDGVLQGAYAKYYPNGQLDHKFVYVDGKIEGPVIYYDVHGKKISEGNYKNNKRVGIWNFYEDGKIVETKNYSPVKNPKFLKKGN